jgi:hypothetical protein
MFGTKTTVEPPHRDVDPAGLIPLSHLALDLEPPPAGWPDFLGRRAIAFVPDDLGRDCVRRQDARRLLDEQREAGLRRAKLRAMQEAEAVENDQRFRAELYSGQPWWLSPPGVTAAQAWTQADRDAQPKRVTPTQEWLDQIGQHAAQTADGE